MKEGFLYKLSLWIIPLSLAWLMRLWFATCRVRVHGREHLQSLLDAGKPVIVSFWHYALLLVFYQLRNYSGVAMVSASRDGEYIARLARQFGLETARGSRNKNGVQALKDLLKAARAGKNTAIVADGSQGPPMVAQPGAILLASRTGVPILPVAWSASRYLSINSWDRTAAPRPFATVDFIYGEPLYVPADIKGDGIEEYRGKLEERLNLLYEEVWLLHGRKTH